MRICDRIFCQNPHIAYFFTYNIYFRIAYAKIMLHMQKFAYMLHISAFFLSIVVLRLLDILAANDYQYLQLDVE